MRCKRQLQNEQTRWKIAICFALSLLMTAVAVKFDCGRAEEYREQEALRWARQIAAQAEGMVFSGKAKGERDPIAWAVGFLSQGVEPRVAQITKYRPSSSKNTSEGMSFNDHDRVYEYTRSLSPETGAGIKIRIVAGYAGFLGTQGQFSSDMAIFAFFALIFAISSLAVIRVRPVRIVSVRAPSAEPRVTPTPDPAPPAAPDATFVAAIGEWTAGSKTALTELGVSVRDLLKQAAAMSAASAKARDAVTVLRDRMHAELKTAREAQRDDSQEQIAKFLREMEIRIEPWTTDADIAALALEDNAAATAAMDRLIDSAKFCLIDQARRIKSISSIVAEAQGAQASRQPEPGDTAASA